MFHVEQFIQEFIINNVPHGTIYKNTIMTIEEVKQHIRTVPDFPTQGIMFKDLTTAFKNADTE